jgi:hypothetical protein
MATPTLRGYTRPFLQRQTGRWSPISGWSFDQDWRGLDLGLMQRLADQFANSGCEYELTIHEGIATLRTTDNRGNITIDTWEIGVSEQATSLLKNPSITSQINFNDFMVLATLHSHGMKDFASAIDLLLVNGLGTFTKPDVLTPSVTQRLYYSLKIDDDPMYFFDQYTLRHTTNASNRGYFNVADKNVNHIYTEAQFYSEIQNGNFWFFPAPPEILGALASIFSEMITPPVFFVAGNPLEVFVKGALKGGSPRSTAANNRVNIVTEYKLAFFATDRYPLAT